MARRQRNRDDLAPMYVGSYDIVPVSGERFSGSLSENDDVVGDRAGEGDGGDDSSDDDFYESEFGLEDDDKIFDDFVDKDAERSRKEKELILYEHGITDEVLARLQAEDGDDDMVDSGSDLDSTCSGDDDGKPKYPKFNPKCDGKDPELKIGLIFSSKNEAKYAIESHCLRRGMAHHFIKNDNRRLRAVCKKEGCGWFVYVAKMHCDHSWQLRSYNKVHNKCNWNYNNPSLTSGWIGKSFAKKFKADPKLEAQVFREQVCAKLGVSSGGSQSAIEPSTHLATFKIHNSVVMCVAQLLLKEGRITSLYPISRHM